MKPHKGIWIFSFNRYVITWGWVTPSPFFQLKIKIRNNVEVCNRLIVNMSGSSGNNLIIENNGKKLLIDLGINAMQIIQSVNYKIEDWAAAICSHR